MFFAIGLLYLIFTLFVEHILWLKIRARTVLFFVFIVVELTLLVNYIILPIFKLSGLKKGINEFEASEIIGKHFPEVNDKLLNMLQLNEIQQYSELIEASVEQKSGEMQLIPFKRAIDFSANRKYIKYTLIPIVILLFVYLTGNNSIFNDSFSRVVHYNIAFEAPAPFSFKILNKTLNVVEGDPFTLQIETIGNTYPEDAKIYFLNENYYLENIDFGKFIYYFSNIKEPINFYLEANGITSKYFQINIIATPIITNLKMVLNYPAYTGKKNEVIQNTGNAIVPQGTFITWQIETHQTEKITFNTTESNPVEFSQNTKNYFSYSKQLKRTTNYEIATSNDQLTNHELLNFTVDVTSDEHPKIIVKSDIDSITSGPVQFIGQLSDDYMVSKLQLVYYDKRDKNTIDTHRIDISKSSFTDFYYVFPEEISIDEGIDYEMYFEVFDNDVVNGRKKTKSQKFSYYNKTKKELKEALLKDQKETINAISKTLDKSKKENSDIEKFKDFLQKKGEINWNDARRIEQFVKRQTQYQEMFEMQTNELEQNLNGSPLDEDLKEKREELQKRIEETKKLADQNKMLEELDKLSEKLKKEDLLGKLKEMIKKNRQNEKGLERILELTKRFYVEQKANQIAEKLDNLAEKEETLSEKENEENTAEKQIEIIEEFSNVKKEIDELKKQNKDLKRPMNLPDESDKLNDIEDVLDKALEELNNKQSGKAKKNQKSAARKMKEVSQSMEQSMNIMEGEEIDEDIDDLRKIVENLIEFSFQQENVYNKFSGTDNKHPEYPNYLKRQHVLKEYFEHIDDSLYVLSLRLIKMSNQIQKEVSDVHYYMEESLLNLSENKYTLGISDQKFIITGANNLANMLSDLLESLMNASASLGKGKGGDHGFSLPDIIKKQGELMEQMKNGIKTGKEGEKSGDNSEQINGELYELYKQQARLRQALEEILGNKIGNENKGSGEAVKQMEELEKELLEKGLSDQLIQKMQQLNYELLKLEKALLLQGEDKKRESNTNTEEFQRRTINRLKLQYQYFNYNEILNRQSLPLRTIYKKKVQEYFKTEQ